MKASCSILLAALLGVAISTAQGQIDSILAPVTPAANAPAVSRVSAPAARSNMKLGEAELFERLARRLTDRLALEDGELSLSPVSAWTPIDLPAGTWDVTLVEAPDVKGLTSSFYLHFRVDAGDRQIGEWQVPVRAQLSQDVWVATRRLSRGETPDPAADLEKRRLNVLGERQAPITAHTALDGYECAQTVAAGQPLTWRDLSPRTLVHRGQVVNVVAADGPFSISMKALATQDGASGATVRVRNLNSQRDIEAQVVGENKVQVRF